MKRKILAVVCAMLAFYSVLAEEVPAGDLIVMTEKVIITSGQHEQPPKSPTSSLCIYQSDNVFYFGEAFVGCTVSLLYNNVTVFSTVVDVNGQVVIPSSLTGVFELQITVDAVVYWAEVIL